MRGYKSNTGKGISMVEGELTAGLEKTETAAWRVFDSTEHGSMPLHIHSQICHKTFSTMENLNLKSIFELLGHAPMFGDCNFAIFCKILVWRVWVHWMMM